MNTVIFLLKKKKNKKLKICVKFKIKKWKQEKKIRQKNLYQTWNKLEIENEYKIWERENRYIKWKLIRQRNEFIQIWWDSIEIVTFW